MIPCCAPHPWAPEPAPDAGHAGPPERSGGGGPLRRWPARPYGGAGRSGSRLGLQRDDACARGKCGGRGEGNGPSPFGPVMGEEELKPLTPWFLTRNAN
ncbi:hypothetical protein NL676_021616 [Syzygium grande]|nr:hypothetical protein NL676_021616 [Syzygium grande]